MWETTFNLVVVVHPGGCGMKRKLCVAACLLAFVAADPRYGCLPDNSSHPWCDSSKSPLERATALVSLLTSAELVTQMDGDMPAIDRLGIPAYHYGWEALHGPIMVRENMRKFDVRFLMLRTFSNMWITSIKHNKFACFKLTYLHLTCILSVIYNSLTTPVVLPTTVKIQYAC